MLQIHIGVRILFILQKLTLQIIFEQKKKKKAYEMHYLFFYLQNCVLQVDINVRILFYPAINLLHNNLIVCTKKVLMKCIIFCFSLQNHTIVIQHVWST